MTFALRAELTPSALSDESGAIHMGWVGDGVLYARFGGVISSELGRAHAARLDALTTSARGISYFSDGSALTRYDLLTRSAFARFVLARPRLFASITVLATNWQVRRVIEPLAQTLVGVLEVISEPHDFEDRLLAAAPFARMASLFRENGSGERRSGAEGARSGLRSSLRPKHPYRRA